MTLGETTDRAVVAEPAARRSLSILTPGRFPPRPRSGRKDPHTAWMEAR